jgi:hypothetical protein
LRGTTRSLEFFPVQISREGAENSARGGRAPHFSFSAFQYFSYF